VLDHQTFASCDSLSFTLRGELYVHVAYFTAIHEFSFGRRDLFPDVSLRFSVPHNYEVRWPFRDGIRCAGLRQRVRVGSHGFLLVGWIVAIGGRSPERTAVVEEGGNVKSSLSGSLVESWFLINQFTPVAVSFQIDAIGGSVSVSNTVVLVVARWKVIE
jgi:hypothetical protein